MDSVKKEDVVKSEVIETEKVDEEKTVIKSISEDIEDQEKADPLIKELYDKLNNSINYASHTSLKAIDLAQQFSLAVEGAHSDQFFEISTPLKNAMESFGMSLKALRIIGKNCGIIDSTSLGDANLLDVGVDLKDIIAPIIKKECELDASDFMDADFYGQDDEHDDENMMEDDDIQEEDKMEEMSGEYKCDMCDHITTEARYLKQHKKIHEAGKYKCEHCDYTNHKPYVMKSHVSKVHNIQKLTYLCERENPEIKHYLCQLCHFSHTDLDTLESHIQTKHIKKNDQDKESEEEECHDDGSEYKCSRCNYISKKKVYFEDHMTGGYKYLKCPYCEAHFRSNTKGKLGRHLAVEHGLGRTNDKWICQDCGTETTRLRYLLHHMAKSHDIGTQLHCDRCSYSSFDRQNLINHSKDHDEASFPCPQCTHLAKSKLRLTKHIYDTHKKGERGQIIKRSKPEVRPVCDICGANFSNATSLSTHIKGMHTHERRECEQCDYVTHNQINLYNHVKTRHSENKFFCDQCEYTTNTRPKFDYHIKAIHQKIRFFCDECDKDFVAETSLKRHKEVKHGNNATKFNCSEAGCEYTTHSSYNLRMHVERVHKGIRWPCDLCDYVGGYKGDLTRHKKIVHV